ncbi:MAG: flavocytochrome c [Cetobacterium sp.]|uniref:flavocytochrome c n=1 Tax=Cetobacterium sp. ZWU0022 TaxID=1340502 RepID=UPI00068FC9AE|nr:flavocytochrome c [Cetobacterium sp. ZWU0022]
MKKEFYSIGEISKITGLSNKTLRYYDENSILKPDYVDKSNGYRYYSEYQILKLKNIITLKDNRFSLEEIKNRFEQVSSREMNSFFTTYRKKIEDIDREIEELKQSKMRLQNLLDEFSYLEVDKIVLKCLPEKFIYNLDTITNKNLNNSIFDIYKIIEASVECGNAYLGKKFRFLNFTKDTTEKISEFLLFQNEGFLKNLEKIQKTEKSEYITIRYRAGNRENALKKILDYILLNKISIEPFIYEIDIINSFLSQNKAEYITEIQIPIKAMLDKEEREMKNGKFKGTGKGYGGDILVEVEISGNVIKNLEILSHNETKIISDPAFNHIPKLIVEANTILVPNVSGCSMSSRGIREAVKNALIEAGENIDKLEIQMLEAENLVKIGDGGSRKLIKPVENFDVVIVGAGGAGLSASISAASKGAKVVLLEKMSSIGGNTLISMGGINIPGNDAQIEKDIQDSIELYRKDILSGGDNENSLELLDIFVNEALPTYRWLKDEIKVSFKDELIHFGGHSVPRAAVFSGKYAIELIAKLRAKAISLGVDIRTAVRSKELITDENKRVVGVLSSIDEKEVKFMAKKGVILATGGFSGNVELRKKYNPSLDERYKTTNISGITGDGHLMCEKVDADFVQMEYIQTFPISNPETGELSHVGGSRFDGAILVNKFGDRFVEELERRDTVSEAILKQENGVGYLVWGEEIESITNYVSKNKEEVERLKNSNLIAISDSLEEIARVMNIDEENLLKTISKYNGFVQNKKDLDFNRRGTLLSIEKGPFYIQKVAPAVHHTMGGVRVNTKGQVLDKKAQPIEGLFAAGEIVGGLHGTNRLGGNAITEIIVFGKRAGENIMK